MAVENELKYALLGPDSLVAPQVDNRLFRFDHKTPQRLVGAAALLAAAYTLFCILWPLRWSLVLTWVVIELIFYVLYWRPRYAELNEQPAKHEPAVVDGLRTFQRFLRFCNELPNGVDYRAYFSGWFKGAPFEDIKRGNAEDFMAYGFWYRSRQQMQDMGLGHVPGEMVDQLESTWGVQFEPGFNSSIQFMGHLWEPLNAHFRPLAFYLSTEAVGWFSRTLLRRWGFEHHKHNGLSYFTLNVPKPRPAAGSGFHSRATSSSTLADVAAAAAVPGTAAPTVPGAANAATANGFFSQPQQLVAAGKAQQAAAAPAAANSNAGSSASRMPSTGSATSATSSSGTSSSSDASGLSRSKSSPFEAGPPDWTPFADATSVPRSASSGFLPDIDASAAAAGAAAASVKSPAGSSSSRRRQQQQQSDRPQASQQSQLPQQQQEQQQQPVYHQHRHTSPPLFSGLSTQTSVMLRHMDNPLERALSEGLGSADTPVLFLHGVGGMPAYLEMMLHVIGLGHPVIAVEFRGVSMRLGRVFTADEVADTVVGVLDKLGVREACVVGHSYGTFIAGYLARHHRRRVHTLCLIDPVCFGMFMPHLLYNFLYRTPVLRSWRLHDLIEYVKDAGRLVASREMHVFTTFARRFYWSDLNLWPEDLAPGSVVLLSGQDDLMDAAEVKDMLDVAGHVKVYYNQDLSHGAFLLDTEVKQTIMAEMRGLLARSGSAVVGLARPVLARTLTLMANGFTHGGAPSNVSMKKGGGNGRYYVEDHGNQLVRTFTGNLTKMLASAGAGGFSRRSSSSGGGGGGGPTLTHFGPGGAGTRSEGGISVMLSNASGRLNPSISNGGAAAAGAAVGAGAGSRGQSGGGGAAGAAGAGEMSASRLLQTFSGPVRRRFSSGYSKLSSGATGAAGGSGGGSNGGAAAAVSSSSPADAGGSKRSAGGAGGHSTGGAGVAGAAGAGGGSSGGGGGGLGLAGKRDGSSAGGARGNLGAAGREGVSGAGRQHIHRIDEGADEVSE